MYLIMMHRTEIKAFGCSCERNSTHVSTKLHRPILTEYIDCIFTNKSSVKQNFLHPSHSIVITTTISTPYPHLAPFEKGSLIRSFYSVCMILWCKAFAFKNNFSIRFPCDGSHTDSRHYIARIHHLSLIQPLKLGNYVWDLQ